MAAANTLRLSGGGGNYAAASSDENIVTVSILEDYLYVNKHSIGKANIIITSADKTNLVLPVSITKTTVLIRIMDSYAYIEPNDNTGGQESEMEEIENEIKNTLWPSGSYFNLSYNSITDDHHKREGTFTLCINPETGVVAMEGRFTDEYIYEPEENGSHYSHRLFTFESDGAIYIFGIDNYLIDYNNLRNSIPRPSTALYWVTDYTENFKNKYPDILLDRAFGVQLINIDQN